MLSRLQLCSLRHRIHELATQARSDPVAAELGTVALELLASLEQTRTSEMRVRATVAELVAACRASVAADRLGDQHPCIHIEHQLDAHGWTPAPDARPPTLLAATASLRTLLTSDAA